MQHSPVMLESFEGTTIEQDENGQLWMRDRLGNIACEVFRKSEDEADEDMLNAGYVAVPYCFDGETVFVEVVSKDN